MTLLLLVAVPLASAACLALVGGRLGGRLAGAIGTSALAFSFGIAFALAQAFAAGKTSLVAELGAWLPLRGSELALRADALSVPLILVITGVSALVALVSLGDRLGDGATRYFATLDLLVFATLLVVLARDLVLLVAGWELIGLGAALLIAYRRERPADSAAGRKALVVGRVGDAAFLLGVFALFAMFRTTDTEQIAGRLAAITLTPAAESALLVASVLLVVAALARSAQPPFHVWLPDAAEAPPPVGAVLQSVTACAAGVILLLRLGPILHPTALFAAAVIGGGAAVLAAVVALAQQDLRRVLAWSTISQVGLMFAAAGTGAAYAAVFALLVHALSKTALLLAAGGVMRVTDGETELRRLGGLARRSPLVALVLTSGALGLAALLPLAGAFGVVVMVTAFLTGLYLARFVMLTLAGQPRATPAPPALRAPLILSAPALVAGVGAIVLVALAVTGALRLPGAQPSDLPAALLTGMALAGIGAVGGVARYRHGPRPLVSDRVEQAVASGFGLERLYQRSLATPFGGLARLCDKSAERAVARATYAIAIGVMTASAFSDRTRRTHPRTGEALLLASVVALLWYWSRG